MNKKVWLYYYGTSSQIVFVRFLGELKTPKRRFEINWPLIFGQYLAITAKVRAGNEETLSIRLVEIKRLCSVTAQKIRNVPQLYTTLL